MEYFLHESVKVKDKQVFKLNQCCGLMGNEFLFLIRNRFPSSDKEIDPIPYSYGGFALRSLSTRSGIGKLCVQAVESIGQFIDPRNVMKLAAVLSDYLAENFEFDLDDSWRIPNSPRVVIAVGLDRCLGLIDTEVYSGALNGPSWGIDEHEDEIVPFLKRLRPDFLFDGAAAAAADCGLSRVPALDLLERGDSAGSCAICLEDLTAVVPEMNPRKMPCNHIFHGRCLARWFWINTSCPMCRSQLI